MAKLKLPTVTLCAATSVNLAATIKALEFSMKQVDFAECLLFTDADLLAPPKGVKILPIDRLGSARAYSHFMLDLLADHIRSPHCLIIQWDGFVLDANRWDEGFLDFDYVGAPWPQFGDGHDVGNGGFSLRSRRLLDACRDPDFRAGHPEDLAICRDNRRLLEDGHAIRFADRATAARFAYERVPPGERTFGFHGIFNMPKALGVDRFWALYKALDDPSSAFVDYRILFRQLGEGRRSTLRRMRLTLDWIKALGRR